MEETSPLRQVRLEKLEKLIAQGIEPYGRSFDKSKLIKEILDNFAERAEVKTAGRLVSIRLHGKTAFCHLRDNTADIQLYFRKDDLGEAQFALFENLDIGDFVGVWGELFMTRTKESTILIKGWTVLSKSLRPLPEKWHGLRDVETRFRQRYVDLIVNKEVREIFLKRSQIINGLRDFFKAKGFLEVETPMMQPLAGGAAARPFKTHHNALDMDLFLRVAPELYLKRLLVGGFERVYELNRNFRNEGLSTRHNPEFTMLEAYAAYWDYNGMMDLTEELILGLGRKFLGLELKGPWPRKPYFEILKEYTKKDLRDPSGDISKEVGAVAGELGIEVQPGQTRSDILGNIFERCVQPHLTEPTFIVDYPTAGCPLAKRKRDDPSLTERFELYIKGSELANAYSELNDPLEQERRFKEQNPEAVDWDFIRALEYGMPPAAGLGIGIDRLVMFLTGQQSIREVIFFPQLRKEA